MIELYGSFTSPYVRHCRVALADEGIDDRFVETDYAASAAAGRQVHARDLEERDATDTGWRLDR